MKRLIFIAVAATLIGCSASQLASFDEQAGDPGVVASAQSVNDFITVTRPFIPEPLGAIVAGLAGLTLGILKDAKTRRDALSVIRAVEDQKDSNGTVNFGNELTAAKLSSDMTAGGKKLVDKAQGKA